MCRSPSFAIAPLVFVMVARAAEPAPGDPMFAEYFRAETRRRAETSLADIHSAEDWNANKDRLRGELRDMLGLEPFPKKQDLHPTVTGTIERDGLVVEKIHFQSLPGLYVTANLYRPKEVKQPLPAVLYLCGHKSMKKGDVSLGNKAGYQHHGIWLARNGYVCLTIDSLQLGEIEGIHHGTYRHGMWWWLNRGYTPAGVEAWNCIRALDYLETRPEVDRGRIGATGRSGGGIYTWWAAALDDRVRVAVPVAGITDLENYVVDGAIEGHCDCMFLHNNHGWDYPQVAALVAPRPLLVINTDSDTIFPIDGVHRTFAQTRRIHRLLGKPELCGLVCYPGPHQDLPALQEAAFAWLNLHLKGSTDEVANVGVSLFEPAELRVFGEELPKDAINTRIHETFVAAAPPPAIPENAEAWQRMRAEWMEQLRTRVFRTWPAIDSVPLLAKDASTSTDDPDWKTVAISPQPGIRLPLWIRQHRSAQDGLVELRLLDNGDWQWKGGRATPRFQELGEQVGVCFSPRGIGPTRTDPDPKEWIHLQRRFQLLGQTLHGQQVFDVIQAVRTLRSLPELKDAKLVVRADGVLAGVALYASLFVPIDQLDLGQLPSSHRHGPYLWNVERVWDLPQALAASAERTPITLRGAKAHDWKYPVAVGNRLGWPADRLTIAGP